MTQAYYRTRDKCTDLEQVVKNMESERRKAEDEQKLDTKISTQLNDGINKALGMLGFFAASAYVGINRR